MITCLGITQGNILETNISIQAVNSSKFKWIWVDFNEPTDEEIEHLTNTFHFHPLAVEDCIQVIQRPKLDYFTDHSFFITHIVRDEEKEIRKEQLDFFVGEKYVVTFHRTPAKEISDVWDRLTTQENTDKWDPYYVFYQILDKIVDNYFPIIYKLEDELDRIEENIHNKSMNHLMSELFDTRYMLLSLRHTINPMRDLLYRMLNSQHLTGIHEKKEYFSDIHDHLLKVSEMVMSNREVTADIRDSYLSFNSHQTNNVMKVLTLITSIFAPLTFIAGIYGMNFIFMPELTWKYGYFLSLGLMALISVLMYMWFKRRGWFD